MSWRQQLVNLGGGSNSFDKEYHLNESWNSEWNLSRNIPPYSDFICISEFRKHEGKRKKFSGTSYLMLLRGHPIDQLPDTAVIVVESADSGIHWMEPRDLDMQILRDSDTPFGVGKLNSYHDGYVNALRKNGEVIQISKSWNKEKVFAVLEGAEIQ